MAVITIGVGDFNKTSTNGTTVYGTTVNFDMPAFVSIDSVIVSFVTHGSSGNTADRAFLINGSRAHGSGVWPSSGLALNAALIGAGSNTFRVTLKAQNSGDEYNQYWCDWNIGSITLTITYTEPGGGDEPPPPVSVGTMTINKSILDAGESITVSLTKSDYRSRDIQIRIGSQAAPIYTHLLAGAAGSSTHSVTWTVPLSLCNSYPNNTSFNLVVMMVSYDPPGGKESVAQVANLTIRVPSTALPTITDFEIERIANVDNAIGGYVKGYSSIAYEITGAAGALGSNIASYQVTADGKSKTTAAGEIGPLNTAGELTITATVKDSRNRTVTVSETITVLDWKAPSLASPDAYRSDYLGAKNQKGTYARLFAGVVISSLAGDNTAALEGRVYQKGGSPGAWTSMTPDTALVIGGGLVSFERTYIAEIRVTDLLGEFIFSRVIPTKKTAISIIQKVLGMALGKVAETPGILDVAWPIWSEGNPVQPLDIGDVLVTFNATSPALRWPGTVWSAITGRFLLGADATYEIDTTGGAATHTLTVAEMPEHGHKIWSLNWEVATGPSGGATATAYSSKDADSGSAGSGNAHNNMPPWIAAYMWRRAA